MGKTIIIQCIIASLSMGKTITIYSSQKVVVVELCTWAAGLKSDAKCKLPIHSRSSPGCWKAFG
jgi:hypothetical protein